MVISNQLAQKHDQLQAGSSSKEIRTISGHHPTSEGPGKPNLEQHRVIRGKVTNHSMVIGPTLAYVAIVDSSLTQRRLRKA